MAVLTSVDLPTVLLTVQTSRVCKIMSSIRSTNHCFIVITISHILASMELAILLLTSAFPLSQLAVETQEL